jgi:transcriptional regulator with XRE-family HTH domain
MIPIEKRRTKPAPHAKLTVKQVLAMRRLAGTMTQKNLAAKFHISIGTANQIIHSYAWRWLKEIQ